MVQRKKRLPSVIVKYCSFLIEKYFFTFDIELFSANKKLHSETHGESNEHILLYPKFLQSHKYCGTRFGLLNKILLWYLN